MQYPTALHPKTLHPVVMPFVSMMVPRRVALAARLGVPNLPSTPGMEWGLGCIRSKALLPISIGISRDSRI